MKNSLDLIISAVTAILLAIAFSFLLAFPIMWLWNFTVADLIDGVHEISYWQAYCLNMLIAILWRTTYKTESKK